MSLVVVGTNHKFASLETREKLSFSKKQTKRGLPRLAQIEGVKAGIILSTCNRVEIYGDVSEAEFGIPKLKDFLCRYHDIPFLKLEPFLYAYESRDALNHLCQVASGLDSQLLGETQILNQVMHAYEKAKSVIAIGQELEYFFAEAIRVSQKVRRMTKITEGDISLGSVAMSHIRSYVPNLAEKKILIIGTGKVVGLLAKYLKGHQAQTVFVSNRTFEKAVEFAKEIRGEVVRFDVLKNKLKEVDIIITSTSSPQWILKKEDFVSLGKSIDIVDLAVPRDVDPTVKSLPGIRLFDLDDLNDVIEKNIRKRKKEAEVAQNIIDEEVEKLWKEYLSSALDLAPLR